MCQQAVAPLEQTVRCLLFQYRRWKSSYAERGAAEVHPAIYSHLDRPCLSPPAISCPTVHITFVAVASMVDSIRKHKKFKQLASYSIQCLEKVRFSEPFCRP